MTHEQKRKIFLISNLVISCSLVLLLALAQVYRHSQATMRMKNAQILLESVVQNSTVN